MRLGFHTIVTVLLLPALLVSCSKKDLERTDDGLPVVFETENNWGDTKASVVSSFAEGEKLAVSSYNTSDNSNSPLLFMDKVLIRKTASGWVYDNATETRYWPEGFNHELSFFAFYPADPGANSLNVTADEENGKFVLEYTREAGMDAAVDVMAGCVASTPKTPDGKVTLDMKHLLANWHVSLEDKTFSSGMLGNRVRVKSLTIACNSSSKATVTYTMYPETPVVTADYSDPDMVNVVFDEPVENAVSVGSIKDQRTDAIVFRNNNTLMIPGDYTSVTVTAVLEIYASVYVNQDSTGDLEVDGGADGTDSGTVPGTGTAVDEVFLWDANPFKTITLVKNLEDITGVEGGSIVKFILSYAYGDVNMSASTEVHKSDGTGAGHYLKVYP